MTDIRIPYSSLPSRSQPIRKSKRKPERRVGKVSGTVRLSGAAMEALRLECWRRDGGICQVCGVATWWKARYDGDPEAFDMAHIKARGAGGSDSLRNVRTLCHEDHMQEHAGKPF